MIQQGSSYPIPGLQEEIRRFEKEPLTSLRLYPELEERFRLETAPSRSRMLLLQGLVALCAFDFFIVADYLTDPQHLLRAALVRLGLVTPIVLLVIFLLRRRTSFYERELAAASLSVLAAVSTLWLFHEHGVHFIAEADTSMVFVLLVINCMLQIDLPLAALTSLLVVLLNTSCLAMEAHMPPAQKLVSGGMLFWAAVLTLAANYSVTRERRFSFLLQLHGRVQRGQLADANAELLALSSTDRLTGLPNRHSYETRLQELWQMTRENAQPLSAVMIDVDHFKRVNDTYGHPYGDRVLQRIATLLQQALRGENDFVARFGGEEFVVLLPNSDETVVLKVADRILTLIRVAGSPALAKDSPLPPPEGLSTVSCGVATAWLSGTSDPNLLISAADQAMYRAKREGRNRVCCSPTGLLGLPRKVAVMPAPRTAAEV